MTAVVEKIHRGRKFDQVLQGARTVFLRDGYERASVDDIAREAGVSKATLYAYFPDKRLLFLEIALSECSRQQEQAAAEVEDDRPAREVLLEAAQKIAEFKLSDFGLQMYRIAVSEAEKFPQIGRAFYETGPQAGCGLLGNYLRQAVGRGELVIDDVEMAAHQFVELCKAGLFNERLLGVDRKTSQKALEKTARAAVDMFMARYGAKANA
jgi:TetR/AcrR family transcriptional regulator, mexJK operon transcriptional repressor